MIGQEPPTNRARAAIRRVNRALSVPATPDEIQRRLDLMERTRALRAAIGPVGVTVEELLDEEDPAADD